MFGATGVVGFSAAVIAALEGAEVTLVGYDGVKRVSAGRARRSRRASVSRSRPPTAATTPRNQDILADAEVAFCAGRAGVHDPVDAAARRAPGTLLVAADVNAVPPPGSRGARRHGQRSRADPHGALGIGPLAIGNIKYKTEFGLFQKMIAATKPVSFDFRDAFQLARELNA